MVGSIKRTLLWKRLARSSAIVYSEEVGFWWMAEGMIMLNWDMIKLYIIF